MSKTPFIPFPGWSPDRVDNFSGGSTEALNVIPTVDGFRPLKSFTRFSATALGARCRGFVAAKDNNNDAHFYAGDKTKLYKLINVSFTDASSSVSGTYDLGTAGVWEFAQFGTRIIATGAPGFVPQQATLGSLTFSTTLITSTDKPSSVKHIAALRDFLVLGNMSSAAGGLTPSRVWWSGIRDPQDFSPNQATQCDYQDFQFGGQVQKIYGSVEYALVFQEEVVRRMNYVGAPAVFDIQVVDRRRGTLIPNSVIGWGRFVFWIAPEGFMMTDGTESVPIGENLVDDAFYAAFDAQYAHLVHSAVDPVLKNVFWSFPGAGNTGENNELFVYHWPDKRWSHSNVGLLCIGGVARGGYTLEALDNVSTDMDNDTLLGPSLDSDKWKGKIGGFGGFDSSNYLGEFNGPPMSAILETGEMELVGGKRSQVSAVRPHIQSGSKSAVDISIGHRKTPIDTITYAPSTQMNVDGICQQRVEDRYHRVRVSLSSSVTWSLVTGVTIEFEQSGDR